MASVEHVEKVLERLVPSALSLRASQAIEEMLDGLAAGGAPVLADEEVAELRRVKRRWPWFGFGAAAAVAAGGLVALWWWPDQLEEVRAGAVASAAGSGKSMELIREVRRLESAVDEGTMDDEAGGMHRVYRYRVIDESFVRKGSSGDVVRVVEPRDELVLMPVTTF